MAMATFLCDDGNAEVENNERPCTAERERSEREERGVSLQNEPTRRDEVAS